MSVLSSLATDIREHFQRGISIMSFKLAAGATSRQVLRLRSSPSLLERCSIRPQLFHNQPPILCRFQPFTRYYTSKMIASIRNISVRQCANRPARPNSGESSHRQGVTVLKANAVSWVSPPPPNSPLPTPWKGVYWIKLIEPFSSARFLRHSGSCFLACEDGNGSAGACLGMGHLP